MKKFGKGSRKPGGLKKLIGQLEADHPATGFMEAEKRFRRIRGYKEIPKLVMALKRYREKLDTSEVA